MGAQAVKVWYLAPQPTRRAELDARMMEVGAAAKAAGLDLIVHATGVREAKVALRAGAVLLVHSVEDQLIDEEFLSLLSANRAVYAPTLTVGRNATRANVAIGLGQRFPIDDPGRCVDAATVAKINNVEPLRLLIPEDRRSVDVAFRRLESVGARVALMGENLSACTRQETPSSWPRTPAIRSPCTAPRFTTRWRRCRPPGSRRRTSS
jgi:imidazolonepropionase-like amidohydrolase